MPRRPRRPIYIGVNMPRLTKRQRVLLRIIIIVILFIVITTPFSSYLRKMSGEMALFDARDLITKITNETINQKMAEGAYDYNYFVSLEKDNQGGITAITTNMSRINRLSSEILRDIIEATESGDLLLKIPIGNLLGTHLLLGRGPKIPIKVVTLSSSHADFRNEFTSAGINHTKHQIILEVVVDIDVFMPWETMTTQIVNEILIAETIVVGDIPDTYLKVEK
ncbi:MAG TPA: sporulation protein YunB [Clostridiales bacterium]|nr:sporulation protein YunB [Clostridiales bacterium]